MREVQDNHRYRWRFAFVLVGLCLSAYLLNGNAGIGGDTVPHRYLPLSLLCEGNFTFNEIPLGRINAKGQMSKPYFLVRGKGGGFYSIFGFAPGVMATPLYAVAAWWNPVFSFRRIVRLGKLSATLMMTLAAVLLFFAFLPWAGSWGAFVLAAVWAFGTSSWSMMSQALWQHSAAAPWLAAALLCLVKGQSNAKWLSFSGLCLGMATLCRPSNLLIALAFTGYMLWHHRGSFLRFAAWAAVPAVLLLAYNVSAFGHPLHFGQLEASRSLAQWKIGSAAAQTFQWSYFPSGIAGMLMSPSRGLFVYSPILVLGALGLVLSLRRGGVPLLRWSALAALLVVGLHSFWYDWWGGWSYGYRLPFDMVFLLVFAMCPLWSHLKKKRARLWAFGLLFALSVGIQGLGALAYNGTGWNARPNVDRNPQRLWSWSDSQILYYLRNYRWNKSIQQLDATPWTFQICPVRLMRPTSKR
ncbi:MAG: hypothetical protein EP343_03780 [Deltaproteobacteria bacterium]|nr:MAG: hypothetical protein EP343_03780 [Deltaproteobacteria bacterium]